MSTFSSKNHKRSAEDVMDPKTKSKKVKVDASVSAPSLTSPSGWSLLPYEILLQVFLYLNDNSDKYQAALTCKSWLRPLSEPSLWHSGNFVFNPKSEEKAIRFVKITGKTLRHICADCSGIKNHYWELKGRVSCTEKVYQFLANLMNSRNQQLLTFRLTNMYSLEIYNGGKRSMPLSEVAQLLAKVLEGQQQLRVLDLSNSQGPANTLSDNLTVKQGLQLLTAASKHCSNTLQTLVIHRLISLEDNYLNNLNFLPQFRNAIASFRNLSDLELSYGYLCDDLLLHLARTSTSLKVITVRADGYTSDLGRTTSAAWRKLTAACRELRAMLFIKPKSESYFDLATSSMLTPSMPLCQVYWDAGGVIAIQNIEQFFQHVARHFKTTLHHLELQTGVRLDMECFEVLFKSLQPCTNLDTLSLGLTCDLSDDVEMYTTAIRDVMTRCPVSCDVTLNCQADK